MTTTIVQRASSRVARRALALAVLLLTASTTARAESLSDIVNPRVLDGTWVSDPSGILDMSERAEINAHITRMNQKSGAELALVAVRDLPVGYDARSLAHHLLNTWGVGVKGADNGVVVVFAQNARRIEVETGYGAEGVLPDGKVGDILDVHAVPHFRAGSYGRGLVATVAALSFELAKGEPAFSKAVRRVGLRVEWLFPIFVAFLVLVVLVVIIRIARRPPTCPDCGEPMRKLDENQERAYLNKEDLFEEDLGSVDHIVWRCDKDREMKITRRTLWFSGFETCRQCGRVTASRATVTTRSPTYVSTGERRITVTCRLPRCRHVFTYTEVIPRRTPPSSSTSSSSSSFGGSSSFSSSRSSSSSFGGGRSGGGGAGRSW